MPSSSRLRIRKLILEMETKSTPAVIVQNKSRIYLIKTTTYADTRIGLLALEMHSLTYEKETSQEKNNMGFGSHCGPAKRRKWHWLPLKLIGQQMQLPTPSIPINRIELSSISSFVWNRLDGKKSLQTKAALQQTEDLYRAYLFLRLIHPRKRLYVPPIVDTFWHAHILHTKKYSKDCAHIFGKFLHHTPETRTSFRRINSRKAMTQRLFNECFDKTISGSRA